MTRNRIGIGVVLLVAGVGTMALLAFLASSDSPPSRAQSALLVIVGAISSLGGTWAMSRKPGDPNLVASRLAIRHLADITTGVGELARRAEEAFDARPPGKGREDIGQLSWRLSECQRQLILNGEDWAIAYPDLIEGGSVDLTAAKLEES